jgi:hypothetical protein
VERGFGISSDSSGCNVPPTRQECTAGLDRAHDQKFGAFHANIAVHLIEETRTAVFFCRECHGIGRTNAYLAKNIPGEHLGLRIFIPATSAG